jgi:hypothetical protein
MESRLSPERLRANLLYNHVTGQFLWNKKWRGVARGKKAGCVLSRGYVQIMVDGEKHLAHRLAWFYVFGVWPALQIDHINGDKQDNRIENLRDVNGSVNSHNAIKPVGATGKRGVKFDKERQKWRSSISVDGKERYLGRFETIDEAETAYLIAKAKLVPSERACDWTGVTA